MSHGRRTNDRRRRVLYSAHQADQVPSTAVSRREAKRLREARRPTAAYGSRVQLRLQGRWFSLVPVRRRSLIAISGLLASLALLLCGAHYASIAWPAIAYHPEIARPLRLDRPDSFGRWFISALLALSAGASLLIYQLRRYRIDDYHGRYRLWRLVLVVLILASVNSLVSIIDWSGALLDAGFGKRVALSGGDWIRLVVSFGGAVLAIRLAVEVRRSRFALIMMMLVCFMLAVPEAAKWNILRVESLGKWAVVTSAPLLACTALFISLGGYLRMLYREVRQIDESDSLRERFQQILQRVFQRSDDGEAEDVDAEDVDDEEESEPRRWWRRDRPDRTAAAIEPEDKKKDKKKAESDIKDDPEPSKERRWFGSRRGEAQQKAESKKETQDNQPPPEPRKKRFSMRLAPPPTANAPSRAKPVSPEPPEEKKQDQVKRRSGLGGWLRRDKAPESEKTEKPKSTTTKGSPKRAPEPSDEVDAENIDWDLLSKAERRRLRKQLKRRNRAA